jgi:imidazolonepropionase-like amidohydrolase
MDQLKTHTVDLSESKTRMTTLKFIGVFCGLLVSLLAQAQDVPTPAPKQAKPILLVNATVHTATGKVLEKTSVVVVDGKITEIGANVSAFKDAETFDLTGKHLWPGLIAPSTTLGIDEIEAVRSTDDTQETGAHNPNARSIIAYNTDSRVIPTVRSNGILLAQVAPQGGLFSGTSSVVQLDAWTWEDAAYKLDDGVFLNFPSMGVSSAWWMPPAEEQRKHNEAMLKRLYAAMDEARAYAAQRKAGPVPQTDARWEALLPVFDGTKPLFIRADGEREIQAAVAFARTYAVRMVLVGGNEAAQCITLLKAEGIPVILHRSHRLPNNEDDPVDQAFSLPKQLQDAGILFCIAEASHWQNRNLPFEAGTAAAYGLTPEQALASVSLNTAKILGIADRTGSIEVGKDANLLVTSGDLLDMRTAAVEMAFIQGRKIDLGNKQKDLAKKFGGRE